MAVLSVVVKRSRKRRLSLLSCACGAKTVDGVKRRTRAGMGRCQGGFCGPRVTQIRHGNWAYPYRKF
ncbi:MAG: (2Fe-2S)-binding protein [Phascolarctobacterium faecium]